MRYYMVKGRLPDLTTPNPYNVLQSKANSRCLTVRTNHLMFTSSEARPNRSPSFLQRYSDVGGV